MRDYFKYIVFHFLSIISGIINCIAALFHYHPNVSLDIWFLMMVESSRIEKEMSERQVQKNELQDKAMELSQEAWKEYNLIEKEYGQDTKI